MAGRARARGAGPAGVRLASDAGRARVGGAAGEAGEGAVGVARLSGREHRGALRGTRPGSRGRRRVRGRIAGGLRTGCRERPRDHPRHVRRREQRPRTRGHEPAGRHPVRVGWNRAARHRVVAFRRAPAHDGAGRRTRLRVQPRTGASPRDLRAAARARRAVGPRHHFGVVGPGASSSRRERIHARGGLARTERQGLSGGLSIGLEQTPAHPPRAGVPVDSVSGGVVTPAGRSRRADPWGPGRSRTSPGRLREVRRKASACTPTGGRSIPSVAGSDEPEALVADLPLDRSAQRSHIVSSCDRLLCCTTLRRHDRDGEGTRAVRKCTSSRRMVAHAPNHHSTKCPVLRVNCPTAPSAARPARAHRVDSGGLAADTRLEA